LFQIGPASTWIVLGCRREEFEPEQLQTDILPVCVVFQLPSHFVLPHTAGHFRLASKSFHIGPALIQSAFIGAEKTSKPTQSTPRARMIRIVVFLPMTQDRFRTLFLAPAGHSVDGCYIIARPLRTCFRKSRPRHSSRKWGRGRGPQSEPAATGGNPAGSFAKLAGKRS
jgi:hypothetical protein